MDSTFDSTGGLGDLPSRTPAKVLLRLSRCRLTGRTVWWLAERAHMRRLYGMRHVAELANLWERSAAGLMLEQTKAIMSLSGDEPAAAQADEDLAGTEQRFLRLLRQNGFDEYYRPIPPE